MTERRNVVVRGLFTTFRLSVFPPFRPFHHPLVRLPRVAVRATELAADVRIERPEWHVGSGRGVEYSAHRELQESGPALPLVQHREGPRGCLEREGELGGTPRVGRKDGRTQGGCRFTTRCVVGSLRLSVRSEERRVGKECRSRWS